MAGFVLPAILQLPLEKFVNGFIQPEDGPQIDFSRPIGEPALIPSDSFSWLIFKNPLALAVGGITAVILELAEPRVRSGIWEHTSFRTAPLPRLQRTALAAMLTVYGPRTRAEAMIASVNRLHGRVHGVTPQGDMLYRADDPELLNWVQATAAFGFVEAYHTYVRRLDAQARDRIYAEGTTSAKLYGASGAPASQRTLDVLFSTMREKLEASEIVFEFLDIMQRAPLLPQWLRPLQGMLVNAAVEILPPWAFAKLQIRREWRLAAWQKRLLRLAGICGERVILRDSPAVQSCRRLGLPEDYLYRRW